MATLEERIAAANKALDEKPKEGRNYYANALKEGLAAGIGNVADVIPRAIQLGRIALTPTRQFLNDPGSMPEVSADWANFNTNLLRRAFGAEQMQAPSQGAEVVGGALRGAASLPLPIGQGGVLAEMVKQALIGGLAGGGAAAGGQVAEAVHRAV